MSIVTLPRRMFITASGVVGAGRSGWGSTNALPQQKQAFTLDPMPPQVGRGREGGAGRGIPLGNLAERAGQKKRRRVGVGKADRTTVPLNCLLAASWQTSTHSRLLDKRHRRVFLNAGNMCA